MYKLNRPGTRRKISVGLDGIAHKCLEYMRAICPVNEGNMRKTMRAVKTGKNEYTVIINPDNLAYYAVYTNEKWIDERWHGKQNPNEKWIDSGVTTFAMYLAQALGGKLSTDGIQERWENKNYDQIIDSSKGP